MAANDSSSKKDASNAVWPALTWVPPLQSVYCKRCGDESMGPWLPLGHHTYMCETCWEQIADETGEVIALRTPPLF